MGKFYVYVIHNFPLALSALLALELVLVIGLVIKSKYTASRRVNLRWILVLLYNLWVLFKWAFVFWRRTWKNLIA